MISASGGLFGLALLASGASLYLHLASDVDDEESSGPLARLLIFFGVGNLPVWLASAVFCAVAGASGVVLTAVGHARLGDSRPAWFPALALLTASAVGLAALRLAAARPGKR